MATEAPPMETCGAGGQRSGPNQATSREQQQGLYMQHHQVMTRSVWELVGAVALTSNLDRLKWYRTSIWTIKFFAALNVTYTVVGLSFLFISIFSTFDANLGLYQKSQFFRLGVLISVFSPLTLCADLLALMGLRSWRRRLLIPWLIIYACAVALSFVVTAIELHHNGIRWPLIVLGFCCLVVFSRWRHMSTQYKLMCIYPEAPPSESELSHLASEAGRVVAAVAAAAASTVGGVTSGPAGRLLLDPRLAAVSPSGSDVLPPKYEDLDQPPKYEESVDTVQHPSENAFNGSGPPDAWVRPPPGPPASSQPPVCLMDIDGGRSAPS